MTDCSQIPDLPTSRPCLGEEEVTALEAVVASHWLGTGALTRRFEDEIASFLGATHVIALNSGTAAIHIALEACGIGAGDAVVVPSFTFVSTIQAILAAGARPIFCDIELDSGQLSVEDALSRITPETRAILPVHYGGTSVELDPLLEQARTHGLKIIEDAAHAFGSSYRDRPIGTLGDVTCFSFDPIKNITCGGGGAAVTESAELAARLRMLSNVGLPLDSWARMMQPEGMSFDVCGHGYRYRMLDLNAAIGLQQLPKARAFQERKLAIVRRYDEAFQGMAGLALLRRDWASTFPFHYAIRVIDGRQKALAAHLRANGIGTTIHFPANHSHTAFARYATSLPVTEQMVREILTLPLYVGLSDTDVERVIDAVQVFMTR